jgi:hypothetical protein
MVWECHLHTLLGNGENPAIQTQGSFEAEWINQNPEVRNCQAGCFALSRRRRLFRCPQVHSSEMIWTRTDSGNETDYASGVTAVVDIVAATR